MTRQHKLKYAIATFPPAHGNNGNGNSGIIIKIFFQLWNLIYGTIIFDAI
jgi:hypothetical protein